MDERTKKLFKTELRFLEQKYGVHIKVFKNKKDRDDAVENIRLGLAMKASLLPEPINELPI